MLLDSLSRADTLNYVLSQLLLQVNELEQTVVHVKNQTESLTETASKGDYIGHVSSLYASNY